MGQSNLKMHIPLNIQRFSGTLTLSNVYETRVDIGSNSSYVHAKLDLSVSSGTYNQTGSAYYYVNMSSSNNSYGTGNQYIMVPRGYSGTLWEGELGPFYHNNDGSLGNVSISAYSYVVSNTQPTASASCAMSTIPRAPSYTSINASSITETSVRLTASIDTKGLGLTGGGWDLSTDGGATWTYYSGGVTDKTITGLTPNSDYWYRGYATSAGGGSNSGWGHFKTYDYPKPTEANNIIIGNDFVVKVSNPLGRSYTLELINNEDSETFATYSGSINGNVTIASDSTIEDTLYETIPTKQSSTYYAKITYSGNVRNSGNYSYTINTNECSPIFNLFTYNDIDNTTTALTGDDQVCIKNYSAIQVSISQSNKATAQKYATMKTYTLSIGDKTRNANYDDVSTVHIPIYNAPSEIFNVYATDSRNLSTLKTITASSVIDYEPIVKNINYSSAKRVDDQLQETGVSEKVLLTLEGSIWYNQDGTKGNFGDVINSITNVSYRYKTGDGNWQTGTTTITPALNNDGTFEFSGLIKGDTNNGFDIANVYQIEVTVSDELSSVVYSFTIGSGVPNVAYAKTGVSIMGEYDEGYGGPFQVEGNPFAIKLWEDETSSSREPTVVPISANILAKCSFFEVFCSYTSSTNSNYVCLRMYKKSNNIAESEIQYCTQGLYYTRRMSVNANAGQYPNFYMENCYTRPYDSTQSTVSNDRLVPRILVGYCYEPRSKT